MKHRIELADSYRLSALATAGPVASIVSSKPGDVGLADRLKSYYHTLIAVIGAVIVLLNTVTPVTAFLPSGARDAVTVVTGFAVALANLLKHNETWVDSL